jgi:hypothetical protein
MSLVKRQKFLFTCYYIHKGGLIMKKLLSILFCLSITFFIYSQEVTVSGGHSVQENKTTKVILNAVNGSVEIHKHVLDGVGYGTGSGSAWNSETGYTSINTNTTVRSSTSEYLCDTPAELIVDKPVKLSIGGSNEFSFTIDPTGGTQYWDIKGYEPWKYIVALVLTIPSAVGFVGGMYPLIVEEPFELWNGLSLIGGIGFFTGSMILTVQTVPKITLVKIEY